MLAAGVDLAVVSKRLGHSSVSITSDTYSHLLEGVGRAAAERAAALVPRNRREQSVSTDRSEDESAGPRLQEPAGERGAPPGTRTPNPRIKSPNPVTSSKFDLCHLVSFPQVSNVSPCRWMPFGAAAVYGHRALIEH